MNKASLYRRVFVVAAFVVAATAFVMIASVRSIEVVQLSDGSEVESLEVFGFQVRQRVVVSSRYTPNASLNQRVEIGEWTVLSGHRHGSRGAQGLRYALRQVDSLDLATDSPWASGIRRDELWLEIGTMYSKHGAVSLCDLGDGQLAVIGASDCDDSTAESVVFGAKE